VIRWEKGGEAEVVALEGDRITLLSTTPSPPGSRVEGVLVASPGDEAEVPLAIRVKVHAAKRQPDGRFEIRGRTLELGAAARERLRAR
jgi:hypothetical protein